MEMIICDSDKRECQQIENYIGHYYRSIDMNVQIRLCKDLQELYQQIKKKEADVIVIAQKGVTGLDIITGMKMQTGKLIWFSDLDFGVQAYRLNVSYFNMYPITQEKMNHALYYAELY